jgi:hypothetical protein
MSDVALMVKNGRVQRHRVRVIATWPVVVARF